MAKYLISFPADAMTVSADELPAVSEDARRVVAEAKAAGVYVFAGGIDADVAPLLVAAEGEPRVETYPGTRLDGGFAVLDCTSREEAVGWARRLAAACRCAQELREFADDPDS
jgi:hypothetical protein